MHSYERRRIAALGRWDPGGWRIKVYGITADGDAPAAPLVAAARRLAVGVLPEPAVTATRHGLGFLGIHQGRDGNLIFLDWWARSNELHHHAWLDRSGSAREFVATAGTGPIACVWDIAVIAFEREAWIRTVLAPAVPDPDAYLAAVLDAAV